MKKFIYIPLLFIYLFATSGIAINFNYCCGKFSSLDLYSTSNQFKKSCNKKEKTKRCCESKTQIIKTENAQKTVFSYTIVAPVKTAILLFSIESPLKNLPRQAAYNNFIPPQKTPIFLNNRVLLI